MRERESVRPAETRTLLTRTLKENKTPAEQARIKEMEKWAEALSPPEEEALLPHLAKHKERRRKKEEDAKAAAERAAARAEKRRQRDLREAAMEQREKELEEQEKIRDAKQTAMWLGPDKTREPPGSSAEFLSPYLHNFMASDVLERFQKGQITPQKLADFYQKFMEAAIAKMPPGKNKEHAKWFAHQFGYREAVLSEDVQMRAWANRVQGLSRNDAWDEAVKVSKQMIGMARVRFLQRVNQEIEVHIRPLGRHQMKPYAQEEKDEKEPDPAATPLPPSPQKRPGPRPAPPPAPALPWPKPAPRPRPLRYRPVRAPPAPVAAPVAAPAPVAARRVRVRRPRSRTVPLSRGRRTRASAAAAPPQKINTGVGWHSLTPALSIRQSIPGSFSLKLERDTPGIPDLVNRMLAASVLVNGKRLKRAAALKLILRLLRAREVVKIVI